MPGMMEYIKCILWPRRPITRGVQTRYRYVIVGMLVTERPLEFEGRNEIMLDGQIFGLGDLLEAAARGHGRAPKHSTGDATSVLLSLNDL